MEKARFISRPNRFTVRCALGSEILDAYLPNPGRLWELLMPDSVLYVVRQKTGENRKLRGMVMAVEREGRPVMLHTHACNDVVAALLQRRMLPGFEELRILQREIPRGGSRFDFLLERNGVPQLLEVKSCTLFGRRIAMFPDAITSRGRRHLMELAELARQGTPAHVLFLVHWPQADFFLPDYHTDFAFASTFLAVSKEVRFHALAVDWRPDMTLGAEIRELEIPWALLKREVQDGGCYLQVFHLPEDGNVALGGSASLPFRKGYYVYVGCASSELSRHLQSVRRKPGRGNSPRGNALDGLKAAAGANMVIPIRTREPLEAELIDALSHIADWTVPSSEMPEDAGNFRLFGFSEHPLHQIDFMNLLLDFRINRLERLLPDIHV
ncbi:MAG: Sugar fermentation stimulation protein A [Syntrophus sp. PtaB.Bin001]|nr:MAG: Sugar fermentation stimulation protein A [Syntrophus sp. PtaB.Bin001]